MVASVANVGTAVLALASGRPQVTESASVAAPVHWSNSTLTATPAPMTTSTVYTTIVKTLTNCPPAVVDCPLKDFVTTVTVPLYTTICPVDAIQTPGPKPTSVAGQKTVTAKVTKIYTVTSCPPVVGKCLVGDVTTEVGTTTYVPVATSTECEDDAKPTPIPVCVDDEECQEPEDDSDNEICTEADCEKEGEAGKTGKTIVDLSKITPGAVHSGVAKPTNSGFVVKPSGKPDAGKPGCNGADCTVPVSSSSAKTGFSLVAAVAGVFFALL